MIGREMSGRKPRAWALSLEMGVKALLEGWDTRVTWSHHTKTAYLDFLTDRQGPCQWSHGCSTYAAGTSFLQITWPDTRPCLGRSRAALAYPFFNSFSHLMSFSSSAPLSAGKRKGRLCSSQAWTAANPPPVSHQRQHHADPLDCLRKWIQQ